MVFYLEKNYLILNSQTHTKIRSNSKKVFPRFIFFATQEHMFVAKYYPELILIYKPK
jgi:hypothetical protein